MATLDFIGNLNIRNILFMAEPSGECIAVSTFCRKHNRRGRFLIIRERLRELLNEAPREFYDMDCGHHLHIHVGMNCWTFTFDWLSQYSDGTLKGYFKALSSDSLTMQELMENMPRPEARMALEGFILLASVNGLIPWHNPKYFFWQSATDPDCIVYRDWIVQEVGDGACSEQLDGQAQAA